MDSSTLNRFARHLLGTVGLLWIFCPMVHGDVSPGDIVIIGLHADAPDQFAWVTLVDLEAGTDIYFTDAGWIDGDFGGDKTVSDGGLRLTVPTPGIAAGKVHLVTLEGPTTPPGYARLGGLLGPEMLMGNFGDQMAVFVGSSEPDFVFAVSTDSTGWVANTPPNYATESELYEGLIAGSTAVAVGAGAQPGDEFDNAYYVGPSTGTREELLAAVADPDNWTSTNDPVSDITNGTLVPGFTILGGTTFRRGDSNSGGSTDLSDSIFIFDFLFLGGPAPLCADAADVTDDGTVDISDGVALLNFLFLGGSEPPSPFGACGPDPTEDSLSCDASPACH